MDIRNDTPYEHGLSIGMGPDRQPCLAIIVKATFAMPRALDGPVEAAEAQQPVLASEEYHQGDLTGSLRLEADAVSFKPRADVVLVGTAYAPGGHPAPHCDVLLEVGPVRKALRVFGDRQWIFPSKAVMVPVIGAPRPFTTMPLVYERAFGGYDRKGGKWCAYNLVGRGFLGKKTRASVDGAALPNIENPARLITSWNDEPLPAGYGFYHRVWQPRAAYAGTEQGLQQPHPIFGLAADFDHAFFNGAHPDLQAPGYLRGDEAVDLINLTRDGRRRFRLPGVCPLIEVRGEGDAPATEPVTLAAPLDTLVLLPDEGVFYQVWRGRYPLPDLETSLLGISEVRLRLEAG